MSGSGNPFDPNQPDGSYYNPFPDNANGATSGVGIDLSPKVGLFGSGYATWMKNQPPPDLVALGAPAGFSTDGTGLPPSVTMTANLPMHTDMFASLQQVLNFPDNELGLPPQAGAQPMASAAPGGGASTSSRLYGGLQNYLNTPRVLNDLQFAQGLSQSFERNGDRAALVGVGGIGLGAVSGNPFVAGGGLGLLGLGALANETGKFVDMGTSALKSIQQGNDQPLRDFERRMAEPDFSDLENPEE